MTQAQNSNIVEVEARGIFVFKSELKGHVGCTNKHDWRRYIKYIIADKHFQFKDKNFSEQYAPYKDDNRVTQELAVAIIQYCRGDVQVKFVFTK